MKEATALVLKDIGDNLKQAAGEAGAADLAEEAGAADTAGMDEAAAAVANDAGAPPGLILPMEELTRAVKTLVREKTLSEEAIVEVVREVSRREAGHAHAVGHRRGVRRAMEHMRRHGGMGRAEEEVPWHRSPRMHELRNHVIEEFRRLCGGHVRFGKGYYYSTVEVQMTVEGTVSDSAFVLPVSATPDNPVINQCFNYGIDDVVPTWFGGGHTANAGDTNLQEPGQGIYQREVFVIEAVGAYLKGLRIMYPTTNTALWPASTAPTGNILAALNGQELVWDRAGRILPIELINQFDDSCELAKTIAEASTFYFNWVDKAVGGDKGQNTKLVDWFSRVPAVGRRGFRETSGGGLTHDLQRGYVWSLDKTFLASSDMGGNGIFNAELHTDESVIFPFQPLRLFGSTGPVMPTGIALYWQLVVHGTSVLPGLVDERYERQSRKRM